jgi:hypothetical protein
MILDRSATFLNWRFSKIFGNYRIFIALNNERDVVGYIVIKQNQSSLDILDMITESNRPEIGLKLISTTIDAARKKHFDSLRVWFPRWDNNFYFVTRKASSSQRT